MKIYAKVEEVGELNIGTSDNGVEWERQQVVFSTTGDRPRMLAIDFMGERKTKTTKHLKKGTLCEVVYEPNSRKYKERWFTTLEGYAVTPLQASIPLDGAEAAPPTTQVKMEEEETAF